MRTLKLLALAVGLIVQPALAGEQLITTARQKDGETVPYVLNSSSPSPRYVLILFPGGNGVVNPRLEGDKLVYGFRGNFLLKVRPLIVDDEFATVATNSTQLTERIQALIDDLNQRFPAAQLYLVGTSNGTQDTMALAGYLSTRIAGEIHTSSKQGIAAFDARKYANRQLVVHHRNDGCRYTPLGSAEYSHEKYGTELIVMEGGINVGDPCEPQSHHGFNGIERETVEAIKQWIRRG